MIAERHDFVNREALAQGLALAIARKLSAAITHKGKALIAVSGGTTPVLLFQHLSQQPITWENVVVTLVDERQVPEDSPRSNARLVRGNLLQAAAAAARFVPLYKNPEAAKLPPFDAVILGMGTDGHTASFFPGGNTLSRAIDPHTDETLIGISAPDSGEPRLTFTLPSLLSAAYLALHIEGREKQAVLEKALASDDLLQMPVRAVLKASTPLSVYWSP
jgi:6-phosphogluconolactonase